MRKIKLPKVKKHQLQILQDELIHYTEYIRANELQADFLNAMIIFDISTTLWYLFRNKVENHSQIFNLSFTVSQASIIMKLCLHERIERDELERATLISFGTTIDQQLKSAL